VKHAFKTPSLRELRMQGPYMHDGQLANLDAVIEHYVRVLWQLR
jgi:cytochrome c peroxidase